MKVISWLYKKIRNKNFEYNEKIGEISTIFYLLEKGFFPFVRGFFSKLMLGKSSGLFFIGKKVTIFNKKKLYVGKNVYLGSFGYFDCFSINGVHFGDQVTIREQAWLQLTSDLKNPGDSIFIGNNTYIGPRVVLGGAAKLEIGAYCQIGANVSFIAENHSFKSGKQIFLQGVTRRGIKVGDDCWIGNNAVVLDGVVLGDSVVVAAGAVVTKSFPSNCVIAGVPAKLIKRR